MASIKKIVYAAAGYAVAEKTYDDATATTEDAPVSLFHDSPYSISKLMGNYMETSILNSTVFLS